MVFKETETHQIFGYSPDTFGIRPADTLFGCVSSRLAVSVAGTVFFWSVQGPRVTVGGESIDLAVPLDLDGSDPATLVVESDVENAFAEYDPATRTVQFVWGRRVYALSIRDPSKPRWSVPFGFASPLNGRARWIYFIGLAGLLWGGITIIRGVSEM